MSKTAKTVAKKPVTKGKTVKKPKVTVNLTVNAYDITMLEISTETRPVWISVKKALAIIAASKDASLVESVNKYGRDLLQIQYGNGKSFTVGINKIDAVVDAEKAILKAIA